MFKSRLQLGIRNGTVHFDRSDKCVVLHPELDSDVSELEEFHPAFVHRSFSAVSRFVSMGYEHITEMQGDFDFAVVHIPRSKVLARHLIWLAVKLAPRGTILVDGAKTQGIESLSKEVRNLVALKGMISGAHGRLFFFRSSDVFAAWEAKGPVFIPDGFWTQEGIFAADGIDRGSALLTQNLPQSLSGRIADLGSGWGFLSQSIIALPKVTHLDCVEIDHAALECARLNCLDDRVAFHWNDATTWESDQKLDVVVMNPPFHAKRYADPEIGKGFILAAARLLRRDGQLWMVANRQLPYEKPLRETFIDFNEIAGDNRFKVLNAKGPIVSVSWRN